MQSPDWVGYVAGSTGDTGGEAVVETVTAGPGEGGEVTTGWEFG